MFYKKVVKCKEDENLQKEKDVKTRLLLSRKVYHFFPLFALVSNLFLMLLCHGNPSNAQ